MAFTHLILQTIVREMKAMNMILSIIKSEQKNTITFFLVSKNFAHPIEIYNAFLYQTVDHLNNQKLTCVWYRGDNCNGPQNYQSWILPLNVCNLSLHTAAAR